MTRKRPTFGQVLREHRLEKGYSLREFAAMVGISPTYLSQVEQQKVEPPTPARIVRMAELLEASSDEWIGLAGRIPDDLPGIIQQEPAAMAELLRAANGLNREQLRELREYAEKLQQP